MICARLFRVANDHDFAGHRIWRHSFAPFVARQRDHSTHRGLSLLFVWSYADHAESTVDRYASLKVLSRHGHRPGESFALPVLYGTCLVVWVHPIWGWIQVIGLVVRVPALLGNFILDVA